MLTGIDLADDWKLRSEPRKDLRMEGTAWTTSRQGHRRDDRIDRLLHLHEPDVGTRIRGPDHPLLDELRETILVRLRLPLDDVSILPHDPLLVEDDTRIRVLHLPDDRTTGLGPGPPSTLG
jgi:hypothetical protein